MTTRKAAKKATKKAKKKVDSLNPGKFYVGGMGEHIVMAELLARGFNVARAVVDEGIDVIAFKPSNPQKLFRIQVKSGFPGAAGAKGTQKYTFTLGKTAYENASGQDYYLVLVLRDEKNSSFVSAVIPKAIFDDYKDNQDVIDWDSSGSSMQISVHLHEENGALTLKNKSGTDITSQTKNRWDRIS
jgi:hypothetical protein